MSTTKANPGRRQRAEMAPSAVRRVHVRVRVEIHAAHSLYDDLLAMLGHGRGREGALDLADVSRRLARRTDALSFGLPVTHVYNPLVYAWAPHEMYLRRYGQ